MVQIKKYSVFVEAELFRDKYSVDTTMRAKGSMGLDVVVRELGGKRRVLIAFDLKTGKSGTSKQKRNFYMQRFDGAAIIDVFVNRSK